MVLLLAFAASLTASFEGGNAGKVEWLSPVHVRVGVTGESDQNQRNRQPSWFYFRIDGVQPGKELTVDLTGLAGEYNFVKHDGRGLRTMKPVFSPDGRSWSHCEKTVWMGEASTLRAVLTPAAKTLWMARQPPYTTRHLNRLLRETRSPHVKQEVIGKTVEGRDILLLTVTNPKIPDTGKKIIWLMARQHSWESGTSWVTEGALRFLDSAGPAATKLRDENVFKILPMCDPDGVVRGGVRFNENGYDLNRNWDAVDPKLMPEIFSQRQKILNWVDSGKKIDLFLTLHNTETSEYINTLLQAGGPSLRALAERFWKLLSDRTSFSSPEGVHEAGETTTPAMKGRMTVNQNLFHERRIPAFLMELMVDPNPKLGRCPTVQDRLDFGAALPGAMADAVR